MGRTGSNKRKSGGRTNDLDKRQRRGGSQKRALEDPSASLERPPPPPPPPKALVKLLQTNANALKYFQALQNNLDFDVRKWKTRARAHEQTCRDLQSKIDQLQSQSPSAVKHPWQTNSEDSPLRQSQKQSLHEYNKDLEEGSITSQASVKGHRHEHSPTIIEPTTHEEALEKPPFVDNSFQRFEDSNEDRANFFDENKGTTKRYSNHDSNAAKGNSVERRELEDEDFDAVFSSDDDDDNDNDKRERRVDEGERETKAKASITLNKPTIAPLGIFQRSDSLKIDLSSSSEEEGETFFAFGSKPASDISPTDKGSKGSSYSPCSTGKHACRNVLQLAESTKLAMNQLKIAVENLERLGIRLVDQVDLISEEVESSDCNGTSQRMAVEALEVSPLNSSAKINSTSEGAHENCDNGLRSSIIGLRRRPDQQVIIDLLQIIRGVTRIKGKKPKIAGNEDITNGFDDNDRYCNQQPHMFYYYPFMTKSLLPCYTALPVVHKEKNGLAPSPHPAVWAVQAIIQSLCIMDVFSPVLDEIDNNTEACIAIDNNQSIDCRTEKSGEDDPIRIGMKGRKKLVSQLVQSLEGEIVDSWGFLDRATRLATVSCHLNPSMSLMARSGTKQPYEIEKRNNDDGNTDDATERNLNRGQKDVENNKCYTDTDGALSFNSKNFVRLSALAERCIIAKIVTGIYLFRQDYQRVFQFFWGYLLSTAPALALEDHPKLPPVQSVAVLEAILCTKVPRLSPSPAEESNSFEKTSDESNSNVDSTLLAWIKGTMMTTKLVQALKFVLESTASIYQARNSSPGVLMDDRITDISRIELAAYGRLQKVFHSFFRRLLGNDWETMESARNHIVKETKEMLLQEGKCSSGERIDNQERVWAITALSLLVQGDAKTVDTLVEESLSILKKSFMTGSLNQSDVVNLQGVIFACGVAKRHLEIRWVDEYRHIVNTPMVFAPYKTGNIGIQEYTKNYTDWLIETQSVEMASLNIFISGIQLCHETADGESIIKMLNWILKNLLQKKFDESLYSILDFMETQSRSLSVRVINLKRRPDRMAAFTAHALNERMTFIKAVTNLRLESEKGLTIGQIGENLCYGMFAIDGRGKAAEVEERLTELVGGRHDTLAALVETYWVPNDLKPFDSDAPDHDKRVLISASEKACALSHISAWKGVVRTLSVTTNAKIVSTPIFRNLDSLRRKHLVSGFARGPSLFPNNSGMEPSEVCVILEDDAVLVDRFTDRLSSLLEELPRDFHFCSLGYSRPKTAPLVPFSSQLGIPTALWYMTGYVISLEGARYLLDKLPIRGPVDSWIGLAMFSNWDNIFGHALGVGVSSKALNEATISREDLRRILRFRAFAASVPLCSQRVGNPSGLPARGRNWRQRDTDITYSGNSI